METANNKAVRPHPGRHRNGARAELARLCVAVSCVSLGLIAAGASAERVLAPYHITATACGTFPEGSPGYWSLDHLYNGDGLAGTGDATTHITDWRNGSAPGEDGYHWTCGGTYGGHSGREGPFNPHPGTVAGQQWVAFRFDHPYALAKIRIWNHQVYFLSQYGFRDTYVQYSASGGSNPAEWTTLWHGELPRGNTAPDPSPPVPASVILDAHGAVAQYVCITSTDAWGPNVYGGLTEVQFTCVSGPGPVLDITVGARTKLSDLQYENQNVVSVSRTGTVAAFYQRPDGVRCPPDSPP